VTGHGIIAPQCLNALSPFEVIAMNPVYRGEIAETLSHFGQRAILQSLGDDV